MALFKLMRNSVSGISQLNAAFHYKTASVVIATKFCKTRGIQSDSNNQRFSYLETEELTSQPEKPITVSREKSNIQIIH